MASKNLETLLNWYQATTVGKPKGYKLTPQEEAKRQMLIDQADAEIALEPKRDSLLDGFKLWRFAAITAPTLGEAKDAANNASDALEGFATLAYDKPTADVEFYRSRIDFILESQTHKRGQLTWSDAVGCPEFWSACGSETNWLLWAVVAAAAIWYGKRSKWF